MQCLCKRSSHGFRAISTPRSIQRRKVFVNLTDIRRKAKVPSDVCMVLGWVITKSNEADTEVLLVLKLARLEYIGTDGLDVLGCRGDVRPLASGAVLYEDEVPGRCERVRREGKGGGGRDERVVCGGWLTYSIFLPSSGGAPVRTWERTGCSEKAGWRPASMFMSWSMVMESGNRWVVMDKCKTRAFKSHKHHSSRFGSHRSSASSQSLHEACARSPFDNILYQLRTLYRLPPINQFAHDVFHGPTPSGDRKLRNKTNSAAVHPPRIAVSVKYIFSRAAGVIARSAPPGIAEWLHQNASEHTPCEATDNFVRLQPLTDSSQFCRWYGRHPPSVHP